ncbi:MAG: hypothetical protein Q4E86_07810 [Lachnospiraceae bacterium]|nr:hypothetical protein [Lachnospiraceae bacterium]
MTGLLERVQWSMRVISNIKEICCRDHSKTKEIEVIATAFYIDLLMRLSELYRGREEYKMEKQIQIAVAGMTRLR